MTAPQNEEGGTIAFDAVRDVTLCAVLRGLVANGGRPDWEAIESAPARRTQALPTPGDEGAGATVVGGITVLEAAARGETVLRMEWNPVMLLLLFDDVDPRQDGLDCLLSLLLPCQELLQNTCVPCGDAGMCGAGFAGVHCPCRSWIRHPECVSEAKADTPAATTVLICLSKSAFCPFHVVSTVALRVSIRRRTNSRLWMSTCQQSISPTFRISSASTNHGLHAESNQFESR